MAEDRAEPRRMPLWALCVVVVLFALAGFGFGVQVGRDAAVARPESAAGLDRYTQPLIFGCLAAAVGLSVWLGSRQAPAPSVPPNDGER